MIYSPTRRRFAFLWATAAVLVAAIGISVSLLWTANAQVKSSGTASTTSNGNQRGGGNNGSGVGNGPNGAQPPAKALSVSGTVTGLIAPGRPASLDVVVRNPNAQAVNLTAVTGTVTSIGSKSLPGVQACSKDWVAIGAFTGSTRIAANGSTTVRLPVTFSNLPVNQDSCKGVTYSFSYTATANQA